MRKTRITIILPSEEEQSKEYLWKYVYQLRRLPKKIVGLRSYYGQLKQKVNSSKKSGAGTDEIFQPLWLFCDDMDIFLKDFLSQRLTESNLDKLSRNDIPSQKASCLYKETVHRRRWHSTEKTSYGKKPLISWMI